MEERKLMIQLSGVKKKYRLGAIGGRLLKNDIQSWFARRRGKEDPNIKIGVDVSTLGKDFYALNGVDLKVYKGERLGIIGVNGAGKSTLLKLLAQITAPTEGEIDLYGRVSSMLEIGTGFHGELTGRDNIYMNGAILGMTRDEIDERLEDIIDFSEVREFIDTPVKRYSSGMFVKLAFAVVAHLNSEIMIMDEVLAVGDMAFQQKCLDRMRLAAEKEGRTVLYVSHNMNTIRRLCDRVIVLDSGRVIFDGDVEEGIGVYMNYSLGEDSVDINLLEKPHACIDIDTGIMMKRLVMKDKSEATFDKDEDLEFALTLDVTKKVLGAMLRVTLRSDADVGIGTGWSEAFDLNNVGEQTIDFRFPLESVKKGVFYVSLGIYKPDELGRKAMYDHITRAFKIDVIGTPNWNTNAEGFVEFKIEKM